MLIYDSCCHTSQIYEWFKWYKNIFVKSEILRMKKNDPMEFKTLTSGMKIISFRNINKKKIPGLVYYGNMKCTIVLILDMSIIVSLPLRTLNLKH